MGPDWRVSRPTTRRSLATRWCSSKVATSWRPSRKASSVVRGSTLASARIPSVPKRRLTAASRLRPGRRGAARLEGEAQARGAHAEHGDPARRGDLIRDEPDHHLARAAPRPGSPCARTSSRPDARQDGAKPVELDVDATRAARPPPPGRAGSRRTRPAAASTSSAFSEVITKSQSATRQHERGQLELPVPDKPPHFRSHSRAGSHHARAPRRRRARPARTARPDGHGALSRSSGLSM